MGTLEINIDDPFERNYYLLKSIKKTTKNFSMKNIFISNLFLKFPNFSILLPYDKFPTITSSLKLYDMSYNDLVSLSDVIKNSNGTIFERISLLVIQLGYMVEDYMKPLDSLIKHCVFKNVEIIEIGVSLPLNKQTLLDFVLSIKEYKSQKKVIFKLEFVNSKFKLKDITNILKQSRKVFFITDNNHEKLKHSNIQSVISIKKLSNKFIKKYYAIMYCLNKYGFNSVNASIKKFIFEQIFHYMGNESIKCSIAFNIKHKI